MSNMFLKTPTPSERSIRQKRKRKLRRVIRNLERTSEVTTITVTVQEGGAWLKADYEYSAISLLKQLASPQRHIEHGPCNYTLIDHLSIGGGMSHPVMIHSMKLQIEEKIYLYDSHFRGVKIVSDNNE